MVKRITTGKKDREKLKLQKRQEKIKRKEERVGGGARSFDDMLAYVDVNGQLQSTPQDRMGAEIDVEDIVISIAKQEQVELLPLEGRVDHFNESKGYGFIKESLNNEKYFFHISSAPANIAEGAIVTFEIERGVRGINAVRISMINKQ